MALNGIPMREPRDVTRRDLRAILSHRIRMLSITSERASPSPTGGYSIYLAATPEGWKAELTYRIPGNGTDGTNWQPLYHKSNALTTTPSSHRRIHAHFN